MNTDTICAVATPVGKGGVGVVRVSGAQVPDIAEQIIGKLPTARLAKFCQFKASDNSILDDGLALYFPAPHSFTGEHVLELQGHGSPVVLDLILEELTRLGARLARPGEFSERAFLNDKIDLVQAESIADLIDSSTASAARAAIRSLHGDFSKQVNALVERLVEARIFVEAAIDFPEEEIDFLADSDILQRVEQLEVDIEQLQQRAKQGSLLQSGATLVLAGRPNAGKSSLLNRLAGHAAAIVTEIPGTTRDVIKEKIQLDGLPINIIDTAGLRESSDLVEQEGIRRTWAAIEHADLILYIVDASVGWTTDDEETLKKLPDLPRIIVANKVDLASEQTLLNADGNVVYTSAKTGQGESELIKELKAIVGFSDSSESDIIARRRHLDAIHCALQAVSTGKQQLVITRAGELLAEELRQAQNFLSEITGEFTSDDLLGRIFSSFCIGK